MVDLTPEDMAGKLMAEGFSRSGPTAQVLSDPITETPMVVTLDELRSYELDPRLTRNPLFDEIKASIRERGLDAPPSITRRPGADHYIIRNGGNTRLAILRELWSETRSERFFRIACLFRPWPARGDIIALTGHLAENELHGGLTFIERALGVDKARELYEQESGKPLSQSELARRLSADGYPMQQSHISRMQDTVRYLLPSIPNVLYKGLGRHQIERLAVLRKAAEFAWQKQANTTLPTDFEMLFHDILLSFDAQPDAFAVERVQDELIGQMAKLLGVDYNVLELEIGNIEHRQRAVNSPPHPATEISAPTAPLENAKTPHPQPVVPQNDDTSVSSSRTASNPSTAALALELSQTSDVSSPTRENDAEARLQGHIVSPANSTERLQAIQQLVAEHTGEPTPQFADQALRAIPVQAGSLFPISDVWYIEPALDSPDRLRIHIAQFAREIAAEADLSDRIEMVDAGIGFTCTAPRQDNPTALFSRAVLALLGSLSTHCTADPSLFDPESIRLDNGLGTLLLGADIADAEAVSRLSDTSLVKLFRLIRLARRLLDIDAHPDETDH